MIDTQPTQPTQPTQQAFVDMIDAWDARREVARLIRQGHTMIGEVHNAFLLSVPTRGTCGCALGAAYVAWAGNEAHHNPYDDEPVPMFYLWGLARDIPALARTDIVPPVGISVWVAHAGTPNLAEIIDHLHYFEAWARLDIATWLETGALPGEVS